MVIVYIYYCNISTLSPGFNSACGHFFIILNKSYEVSGQSKWSLSRVLGQSTKFFRVQSKSALSTQTELGLDSDWTWTCLAVISLKKSPSKVRGPSRVQSDFMRNTWRTVKTSDSEQVLLESKSSNY